jgi:hypothetical protein
VTETFPLTAISGAWPRLPIFCQNPHDTYDLPRTNATATREEEIAALVQQGEEVIQQQGGMPILRVASEEYEEKSPDAEALVRQTKKRHQNTPYLLNISGQPPCRKPILRLYSAYDEVIAG